MPLVIGQVNYYFFESTTGETLTYYVTLSDSNNFDLRSAYSPNVMIDEGINE